MNPMAQSAGPLLPESKLIRPDQVPNLGFLSPEEKTKYSTGIAGLRRKMQDNPPNHPDYLNAYHRLSEVTNRLRQQMMKFRQQMGQQMPSTQQQHPSMQVPMDGPPQMLPQESRQAPPEFSQRVRNETKNFQVTIPASLRARSMEEQQQWANGQRLKYAKILQSYEGVDKQLKDLQQQVQVRQANNNPLSNEEKTSVTQRVQHLTQIKNDAQKAAVTLKQQHEHARQQQMHYAQQVANHANATSSAAPPTQNVSAQTPVEASEQDTVKADDLKSGAKKEEAASVPPGAITHGANIPAPSGQNQTQVPPAGAPSDTSLKPEASASSPSTNQVGTTKPLSHQDAIMRASQNYTQSSQQPPHGHPIQPQSTTPQHEQPSASSNLNLRPPNRPINVAPPQPVPMPQSRPTISGGHGAQGPMGQPAIPKVPGFVLEGEGERVLSKKKLEELVRQVTGGAGSNESGEALDPDVEEVSITASLRCPATHSLHPSTRG